MKSMIFLLTILVAACASNKRGTVTDPASVTETSFKKDKALNNSQVSDYYLMETKGLSPALQDETLDRHSKSEVSGLKSNNDPLVEIAVRCAHGDYKEGFEIASKNFDKYQKVALYWNLVANCHLNEGSQRKALLFYNKALEVSPNYVPALNNIGVLYARTGQDQKAQVAFERANRQGRFAKTPRYNLARLYLAYGLADQALTLFNPLLETSPQDVDLLNSVASAYFLLADYRNASSFFDRIPKNLWSRPEIGLNASLVLKKLGKIEEAKSVFSSIDKPKAQAMARYYSSVGAQLGEK